MALVVDGHITRAELALGNLDLEQANKYRIVSAGPGALSWRRAVATSPYTHGEVLVGAVKDVVVSPLTIRVLGSSAAVLNTNVAELLRAFEQFNYDVSLTIDGQEWRWRCEPADYAPGDSGAFEKFPLMQKQQIYTFQIPRSPTPLAGSM